jgi:TPR repeat protein
LRNQPDPDLAAVYERAEQLRADGKLTDAWLTHFFAARKGYAPSALVLGTLSDPAYRQTGQDPLEESDPAQALKWYKVAADAGDTEAERRLKNLRERTERAAADGDVDAQRLLLQWR